MLPLVITAAVAMTGGRDIPGFGETMTFVLIAMLACTDNNKGKPDDSGSTNKTDDTATDGICSGLSRRSGHLSRRPSSRTTKTSSGWYWTGHLQDTEGTAGNGFEEVFFLSEAYGGRGGVPGTSRHYRTSTNVLITGGEWAELGRPDEDGPGYCFERQCLECRGGVRGRTLCTVRWTTTC